MKKLIILFGMILFFTGCTVQQMVLREGIIREKEATIIDGKDVNVILVDEKYEFLERDGTLIIDYYPVVRTLILVGKAEVDDTIKYVDVVTVRKRSGREIWKRCKCIKE